MQTRTNSNRFAANDALAIYLARKGYDNEAFGVVKRGISEAAFDRLVSFYARHGSLDRAIQLTKFRGRDLRSKEVDLLVDAYLRSCFPNYACSVLEYHASDAKVEELVGVFVSYGWLIEATIAAEYRKSGVLTSEELDHINSVSTSCYSCHAARSRAPDNAMAHYVCSCMGRI